MTTHEEMEAITTEQTLEIIRAAVALRDAIERTLGNVPGFDETERAHMEELRDRLDDWSSLGPAVFPQVALHLLSSDA